MKDQFYSSSVSSLSIPFRGDPIPSKLIEKVDEYIPQDLNVLFDQLEVILIYIFKEFPCPSHLLSFHNYCGLDAVCTYMATFLLFLCRMQQNADLTPGYTLMLWTIIST